MTVKEFVDGYNKTSINLRDRYIKEKLEVKDYVGFKDKYELADRIINITLYEKDKEGRDTGNIRVNSVLRYLLSILSVIDKYTNIDVDFSDIFNEYDLLDKNDLIELFVGNNGLIPDKEYSEFQILLTMKLDDELQNNLSTKAFVQHQVERFSDLSSTAFKPVLDKIAESINNVDENSIEKFFKDISRFIK